jgi:inhibitor of cysteine peptidase
MIRVPVLLSIAVVALAACSTTGADPSPTGAATSDASPPSSPGAAPGTLRLDDGANGSTVTVAPGAVIVLVLPSNPTTGYSWTVTSLPDPGHVSLDSPIEGVYVATPVASGVVGSGGTQSWDLHATKAGTTSIALAYVRPWESGVPPVEAFAVTFVVQ